jgi:hypothetical protein
MSRVVGRQHCPRCGSRDNVAVYEDGGQHCFTPGCGYHLSVSGSIQMPPFVQNETQNQEITPILGSYVPLKKRGISDTTCKQFGYFKGTYGDSEAYYWPIYDKERRLTGYKIRKPNKQFVQHGTNPDNTFSWTGKNGVVVGSCSLYSKGSTTVSLTLRSASPGLVSRCRTALIQRRSALGRILIGS